MVQKSFIFEEDPATISCSLYEGKHEYKNAICPTKQYPA